jgi:energy-coupling factor transporter transmembrane protein EcfT
MAQVEIGVPQAQVRRREWVRSFLFWVRVDSPLAALHVLSKLFAVLAVSLVIFRFIDTQNPDPVGATLMILLGLVGLYLGGVLRWISRSYLIAMFPGLLGMALAWIFFNPSLGGEVLATIPLYSGVIMLGVSLRLLIAVAFAAVWYIWRKRLFWGIVGGALLAVAITAALGNPALRLAQVQIGGPVTLHISEQNLLVGFTKALGYGAMMLVSLTLVMTTRDIEVVGALRQLRVPYVASFFAATMLRSLSMALADYGTIRQAQHARGIALQRRNLFRRMADLAATAVPLTATMLRRAREVGDAALIRGFSMQSTDPTEFHEVRAFRAADWIVVLLCTALAIIVLGYGVNFTALLSGSGL